MRGVCLRFAPEVDPDVVVLVLVVVPEQNVDLVRSRGVADIKSELWLEAALPLMRGNRNDFFVEVDLGAGGEKPQAASNQLQAEKRKMLVSRFKHAVKLKRDHETA